MLPTPLGRSAIEIGWFVMLVPGWFGGKRTPPILRAPMAPWLESTDFALSQSGSASDSSRQIPLRAPAPRWAPPAPGALVRGGPVSWARARGGLIAGSESGAGGENVHVRGGQHAGSASRWLAVARMARSDCWGDPCLGCPIMAPELIGRDPEIAAVESLLAHIGDGGGSLLVLGDPGIGKSVLAATTTAAFCSIA